MWNKDSLLVLVSPFNILFNVSNLFKHYNIFLRISIFMLSLFIFNIHFFVSGKWNSGCQLYLSGKTRRKTHYLVSNYMQKVKSK